MLNEKGNIEFPTIDCEFPREWLTLPPKEETICMEHHVQIYFKSLTIISSIDA